MAQAIEFKDKKIKKLLRGIESRNKDITKHKKSVAKILSPVVVKDIDAHFQKEEGPKGTWQRWAPATVKAYARTGKSGNKVLSDTGRLRNSIKPGNVKSTSIGFVWFTNEKTKSGFPYAEHHDEKFPKGNPRTFMWTSKKAVTIMSTSLLKFLAEGKR